jgi:hypothetical protein
LALGGRCFNDTHNNQTQDGFHVTVDVGEDALPGQSVWGNNFFARGSKFNNNKMSKTKIFCGLGQPPINIFHSTTDQKHAGGTEER